MYAVHVASRAMAYVSQLFYLMSIHRSSRPLVILKLRRLMHSSAYYKLFAYKIINIRLDTVSNLLLSPTAYILVLINNFSTLVTDYLHSHTTLKAS